MDVKSIDKLVGLLRDIKENFVLANEQDIVTLVCGYEGSGKSILTYYLGDQLDPDFSLDRIPFSLEEYFEIERKWASDGWEKKRGSVLVLDEGGSELLSRNYMDKKQKKFINDMIRNRYMSLFRFICVPKPKYMDVYIREERVQNVLYTYYDLDDEYNITNRYAVLITKSSWSQMLEERNWKSYFYSSKKLINSKYVDGVFKIPDLKEEIGREEINRYLDKKVKGHKETIKQTKKEEEEVNAGTNEGKVELIKLVRGLRYNDDLSASDEWETWKDETGMTKPTYYQYVKKYAPETLQHYNGDKKKETT